MFKNIYLDTPTDVTALDATLANNGAGAQLGEYRWNFHATYGWQKFRYVYNNSGVAILAGKASIFAASSAANVAVAGANADKLTVAGIPQVQLPNLHFGWALVGGRGLGLSGAAVTTNRFLFTDAAGRLVEQIAGDPAAYADRVKVIARALTAALAIDTLFEIEMLLGDRD